MWKILLVRYFLPASGYTSKRAGGAMESPTTHPSRLARSALDGFQLDSTASTARSHRRIAEENAVLRYT